MKKNFIALTISILTLAACNNSENKSDSSVQSQPNVIDSTVHVDSSKVPAETITL